MSRSPLIDAIKAVASQLIVLHHLALYAPMSDAMAAAWPAVMVFLSAQGRLAVQPFLVIGGFLTAQALERRRGQPPWPQIAQRYLRLAPPLWLALLLVVLATALVGRWLPNADWLSPLPSVGTVLAHLFLLQDVLGVPALSAGVWYVAIDFQLFTLFALLARAFGTVGRPLAATGAPALVALATASALYGAAHLRGSTAAGAARGLQRAVRFLADASYDVFVGHFAVIILFSGLWHAAELSGPVAALAFAGLAWALSIALGAGLQRAADRWTPQWTPRWRSP